ncbi:MAG: globin [Planctomycetaceae bacterium]
MTDPNSSQPSPLTENQIHSLIGSEGITRMVAAFYRQIPQDDILGPMYPSEDLQGAEERLRLFLIFRFGGPENYLQLRGHPRLRLRHAPFVVNQAARDRWMLLMNNAISECGFSDDIATVLKNFLGSVATFLINR